MSAVAEAFCHRRKRSSQANSHRQAAYYESIVFPGPGTDVRETQKVKRLAFTASLTAAAFLAAPAELDQTSLFPVQSQSELVHSPMQSFQTRPRVGFMFEADDEVVRITSRLKGRDQGYKIDQVELAVEFRCGKRLPAVTSPPAVAMRPETPHNPTVELIEELADVCLAVMQTPAAYDRIDFVDELPSTDGSFATRAPPNLILEVLDRLLTRDRVEWRGAHPTANFLGG